MSALVKTSTVLHQVAPDTAVYRSRVEDVGDRAHAVLLDLDVWRDLGRPVVITVTIEPGDRLNDG